MDCEYEYHADYVIKNAEDIAWSGGNLDKCPYEKNDKFFHLWRGSFLRAKEEFDLVENMLPDMFST